MHILYTIKFININQRIELTFCRQLMQYCISVRYLSVVLLQQYESLDIKQTDKCELEHKTINLNG